MLTLPRNRRDAGITKWMVMPAELSRENPMRRIYSNTNLPANVRAWYAQRYKPAKCRYCGKPIIFLKDIHWNMIPCDAIRKIFNPGDPGERDRKVMGDDGMITKMGRRFGSPVHECLKQGDSGTAPTGQVIPQK